MKITKKQLKEIIKEEIEALSEGTRFRPDSGGLPVGSPRSREEILQQAGQVQAEVETLIAYLSQEERPPTAGLEEKKDEKFLQDVESTGEWTDYTIAQLQKKKDTLMKKEKRTADEVTTVRQLNFAINAKQGDYKKKD